MKKITYAILITAFFLFIQKLTFNLLYKYGVITGILRDPYLGFMVIKAYTFILLLFSIYNVIKNRNEKTIVKKWIPLLIFFEYPFSIITL
jgi:hypothetical protein